MESCEVKDTHGWNRLFDVFEKTNVIIINYSIFIIVYFVVVAVVAAYSTDSNIVLVLVIEVLAQSVDLKMMVRDIIPLDVQDRVLELLGCFEWFKDVTHDAL